MRTCVSCDNCADVQDPVLFSGTIRSNLDPFRKYSESELWESLNRTTLSNNLSSLDDPGKSTFVIPEAVDHWWASLHSL
jgi:ABC-type multidrug transport system fused ATPase/permease subunit